MSDKITQAVGAPLERQGRPRLWVVRVVREAYVLADTKDDALQAQGEIERWEDNPTVTAAPAGKQRLRGWDNEPGRCLVYGTDKNTTLAAARLLVSGA